ncbi:MAG: sulfotransferase [Parvibaculum sp.]|uniref:tetratricopeptide repeat-containing sulfotransferase family protein n=1 Tax=Parvibaculum sp. TaxID=2024848 RepID=UPI0025DA1F7C|nr:tetratricopeptide repeat-containing sulfotransferase family protein [Parvibaculum sp.]MCE9648048.1 sulfotransferase [Parvibaculum sp.]
MAKRPPQKGQPPIFAGGPAARPTVGLPGSAMRPTVRMPQAVAAAQGPSDGDIEKALRLAAAHLGERRYAEAARLGQKVLQFRPNQADALHLLGLVAHETGKSADGERLIEMAVRAAKQPSANMLVNLGNARREQGKLAEALEAYNQALARDPFYADAFFERGVLRNYERDARAALEDFQRVMELCPDNAAPYARAAEALTSLGLFREALVYCNKIMERDHGLPAQMFAIKANILERLSELDEAIEMAEKALSFDNAHVEASRVWARAQRRLNGHDPEKLHAALARLQAIDVRGLSFNQIRSAHDERAQIYDKLKDYDAAFAEFTAMNDAAERERQTTLIDKNDYLRQVEALIEGTVAERVQRWRHLPAQGIEPGHRAAPVFLVGFPRSGTTLLDQIVDAHPDFQVIEEQPLLRAVRDAAAKLPGGYPVALEHIDETARAQLRQTYWDVLAEEGADVAGKIVVDKMPLDIIHAGLISRVFPEAKIVLALRHPADCVLSCFMQNFQLNGSMVNFHTLPDAARLYDRVMTLWQQNEKLLPLNVHEVRYEKLIVDLRGEVEPLLHFLGAEWNEAQADPAAHALARGTIRTPSYQQVTQPIYGSAADRWRRYEKHLAAVLPVLEKHIRHFGYAL